MWAAVGYGQSFLGELSGDSQVYLWLGQDVGCQQENGKDPEMSIYSTSQSQDKQTEGPL